jgi:hypothetical protein
MTCEQQDEPTLGALRKALTEFRRQAVVAKLILFYTWHVTFAPSRADYAPCTMRPSSLST